MEKIKELLRIETGDGYGYGDGSGSGYGSGDGYGDGSGSGYGSGDGYGDGSGDGSGYGYGDGSGYGSGYGDGYGSGDGSGYGYGDGSGVSMFEGQAVYKIDDVATIIKHIKGSVAKGFIMQSDFSLTPCYVVKGHGYFAHGETLKAAQEALEEKMFDDMDAEEKIKIFIQQFQVGTVYPAKDFYVWHNKLTGSCEMGRKAFAKDHDIDIESDSMTVEEFINLTKNSFGGSIIRQIADELEISLEERE